MRESIFLPVCQEIRIVIEGLKNLQCGRKVVGKLIKTAHDVSRETAPTCQINDLDRRTG